ncbi:hypothetical protein, partial [Halobacterium salinarum]|uniref:hypothetical protein n=1 Tax=Halobacterium salinarum TaxID=2242 RepID=UPI003904BB9C
SSFLPKGASISRRYHAVSRLTKDGCFGIVGLLGGSLLGLVIGDYFVDRSLTFASVNHESNREAPEHSVAKSYNLSNSKVSVDIEADKHEGGYEMSFSWSGALLALDDENTFILQKFIDLQDNINEPDFGKSSFSLLITIDDTEQVNDIVHNILGILDSMFFNHIQSDLHSVNMQDINNMKK